MIQTHRKLARAIYALIRNKPVPTVFFATQKCFFKIPLGAKRRKQLIREVRIAKLAGISTVYGNRAVLADWRFGTLACAVKHESSLDYAWIIDHILELWQTQFTHVKNCSYMPAATIIDKYFNQLRADRLIDVESFKKDGSDFELLQLPLSFMHGDLAPSNIVRSGDEMLIIDWEWGNEMGTVLYDWWYFLEYLRWLKERGKPVPDFSKLDEFIKNSFQELGIDFGQFTIFAKLILSFKTTVLNLP